MFHKIKSVAKSRAKANKAAEVKQAYSGKSEIALLEFIRNLPKDAFIMKLKAKTNMYDEEAYISAEIAIPVITDDLEIGDYKIYRYIKRWNKDGKLTISETISE